MPIFKKDCHSKDKVAHPNNHGREEVARKELITICYNCSNVLFWWFNTLNEENYAIYNLQKLKVAKFLKQVFLNCLWDAMPESHKHWDGALSNTQE